MIKQGSMYVCSSLQGFQRVSLRVPHSSFIVSRPRDVRNGSEIFVSCSAISDDLDDPSSNSYSCCGLRLFRAHAFDRGPLVYEPKLGPTVWFYLKNQLYEFNVWYRVQTLVYNVQGFSVWFRFIYLGFRVQVLELRYP